MFDWLREELRTIKNRKFHLVPAPAESRPRAPQTDWPKPPPEPYRRFLAEFGAVLLYRELDYWLIRVWERPFIHVDRKRREFLEFGGYDSGRACFRTADLGRDVVPVYETRGVSGLFITAKSFDQWIESRAKAARRRYRRSEWTEMVRGPKPFTADELEIVEARKKFEWRLLEVSSTGMMTFQVHNRSHRRLPFLTLGVRGPNLEGGIRLNVGEIGPGESRLVEQKGYTCIAQPELQEAFGKPDPWPEDRDCYGEFRELC